MDGQDGGGELPFVGAQRIDLVEELLCRFDEVSRTRVPQWVALEAPTGWGKSRIAQEFYGRLAAERQDDGPYWPSSIVESINVDDTLARQLHARRKRVYPEVIAPPAGSTPAWFWWGFGCDDRYGSPLQALAFAVRQFEHAKLGFEARWRERARLRDRAGRILSDEAESLGKTVGGELVGAGLAAANVAVPGLGILLHAVDRGVHWLRNRESEDTTAAAITEASGARGVDLVDEVAPAVGQVARKVVPIVIFVEDLHRSDQSLVELLARVLSADDTRVLVITTAWPGSVEEEARPSHGLVDRVPADRCTRHTTVAGGGDELSDFTDADVRVLATTLIPDGSPELIDVLVERYSNPLALQLACSSKRLEFALDSGGDVVRAVRGLPQEVRDLYEEAWKELPASTQLRCMLAVLSTPAGISLTEGRGDDRWDHELVDAGIRAVPWLSKEVDVLDTSLADAASSYAWVRTVDQWLRQFHEPLQFDIASARPTRDSMHLKLTWRTSSKLCWRVLGSTK